MQGGHQHRSADGCFRHLRRSCSLTGMLVFGLLLAAPAAAVAEEMKLLKSYESFAALRSDILDFISGANARVWMHSDYLTDGEIVTSLFVAKYRKLDVQVLLGKRKANAYMSRLNYLKGQNITVYLKPDTFKTEAVSAILGDDELVFIDGELDFMSRYKKFNVYIASKEQTLAYQAAFAQAAGLEVPAVPAPMPLVGRPGNTVNAGSAYKPVYSGNKEGTYTYGRSREPRPAGVPAKLPKEPKWQRAATQAESDVPAPLPDLPAEN